MSRLGISFADVAAAADELMQEGTQPTIEKIRDQLGKRGSFSTISKYLKDWREGRFEAKSSTITPPDQVQIAVSAVWEKLHHETQTAIDLIKAEASEQVNSAKKEAETANSAFAALKAEYEQLKTEHHAMSSQKELLVLDLKQTNIDLKLLRAQLNALESRHQEIKTLHAEQLKRMDEKYLTEFERLRIHSEQEVKLAHQLADALKVHYEDMRADNMLKIDSLNVENQKCNETIKRFIADNASLKESIATKTMMYQQIIDQFSEAQKIIQMQQTQWNILQDKFVVTEDVAVQLKTLPMQLKNELQTFRDQGKKFMANIIKSLRTKRKGIARG